MATTKIIFDATVTLDDATQAKLVNMGFSPDVFSGLTDTGEIAKFIEFGELVFTTSRRVPGFLWRKNNLYYLASKKAAKLTADRKLETVEVVRAPKAQAGAVKNAAIVEAEEGEPVDQMGDDTFTDDDGETVITVTRPTSAPVIPEVVDLETVDAAMLLMDVDEYRSRLNSMIDDKVLVLDAKYERLAVALSEAIRAYQKALVDVWAQKGVLESWHWGGQEKDFPFWKATLEALHQTRIASVQLGKPIDTTATERIVEAILAKREEQATALTLFEEAEEAAWKEQVRLSGILNKWLNSSECDVLFAKKMPAYLVSLGERGHLNLSAAHPWPGEEGYVSLAAPVVRAPVVPAQRAAAKQALKREVTATKPSVRVDSLADLAGAFGSAA
jgi:hypothetical protein